MSPLIFPITVLRNCGPGSIAPRGAHRFFQLFRGEIVVLRGVEDTLPFASRPFREHCGDGCIAACPVHAHARHGRGHLSGFPDRPDEGSPVRFHCGVVQPQPRKPSLPALRQGPALLIVTESSLARTASTSFWSTSASANRSKLPDWIASYSINPVWMGPNPKPTKPLPNNCLPCPVK